MEDQNNDVLLDTEAAARVMNVSKRMLEVRRLKGNGPRHCSISRRCVRYKLSDILLFIEEHMVSSTAEATVRRDDTEQKLTRFK